MLSTTTLRRYPASTLITYIAVASQPSPSRKIGAKMTETGEVRPTMYAGPGTSAAMMTATR